MGIMFCIVLLTVESGFEDLTYLKLLCMIISRNRSEVARVRNIGSYLMAVCYVMSTWFMSTRDASHILRPENIIFAFFIAKTMTLAEK